MNRKARTISRCAAIMFGFAAVSGFGSRAFGDLVAQWHFDEPAGSAVAHDSVGNAPGVPNGSADFVPGGVSGKALSVTLGQERLVDNRALCIALANSNEPSAKC